MALRKFDIGASIALAVALVGGIFFLGNLNAKIEAINTDKLDKKIEEAVRKVQDAEKSIIDQLPVGTVISSVLEPDIFLSGGRNKKWHLADDSTIPIDSEYKKLVRDASIENRDRLPDLRGMFLRGLNVDRNDGKQDPDGINRVAGSYQGDQLKSHAHGYSRMQGVINGSGARTHMGTSAPVHSGQSTSSVGGAETRSKNISVYFYIKIN